MGQKHRSSLNKKIVGKVKRIVEIAYRAKIKLSLGKVKKWARIAN